MLLVTSLLVASLVGVAHAGCWEASLSRPGRAGGTGVTDLTVTWEPVRPADCAAELSSFDHYRVEIGRTSAPTRAGDGRLVARVYDRDATVFMVSGLTPASTVYVSVFACDEEETCLDSDDESSYSLSATLDSGAGP